MNKIDVSSLPYDVPNGEDMAVRGISRLQQHNDEDDDGATRGEERLWRGQQVMRDRDREMRTSHRRVSVWIE